MMRERYESISLIDLKEMAKFRGIKITSSMKKGDIVEAMLAKDVEDAENAKHNENDNSTEDKSTSSGKNKKSTLGDTADAKKVLKKRETKKETKKEVSKESVSNKHTGAKTSVNNAETKSSAEENVHAADIMVDNGESDKSILKSEELKNQKDNNQNVENLKSENKAEVVKKEEEDYSSELDSGKIAKGILEVMPDGFGFIRSENFLPGDNDVYVAPGQIRRFGLRTGDVLEGHLKVKGEKEKFAALLYLSSVNGFEPEKGKIRCQFENMTPIFPEKKIKLEVPGAPLSMRIMDLLSPVGKGQRGMIVSPPKAGKTTLLKSVAKSVKISCPDMHMIILLIDERPEEVTDIKEEVMGPNVEVIYSTFDETPEHHKRVSEMAIERARRLVEYKKDVIILLDSITRLTRAYNQVIPPSGRTLSGGLDPAALHMPKRFFGAARNMREGGSLTILATALVETGSKMDDVVYEEFKGTGNMEIVLDRKLSERRVFPAIDIAKSGTRRDDLLLNPFEMNAINMLRRSLNDTQNGDAVDKVLDMFSKTRSNEEFIHVVSKTRI